MKIDTALLVATTNRGKFAELSELLSDIPVRLLSLDHFPSYSEIAENGSTFEENAKLKAAGYAVQSELWTLADDSGLEVTALEGRPGVASARFAGKDTAYSIKIAELLAMMDETGTTDRSACFTSVIALADPEGNIQFKAEGICVGRIADAPRGGNGFGYDPIFVPEGFDETFGELNDEVKRSISHRARAAREIVRYLLDFIVV